MERGTQLEDGLSPADVNTLLSGETFQGTSCGFTAYYFILVIQPDVFGNSEIFTRISNSSMKV